MGQLPSNQYLNENVLVQTLIEVLVMNAQCEGGESHTDKTNYNHDDDEDVIIYHIFADDNVIKQGVNTQTPHSSE